MFRPVFKTGEPGPLSGWVGSIPTRPRHLPRCPRGLLSGIFLAVVHGVRGPLLRRALPPTGFRVTPPLQIIVNPRSAGGGGERVLPRLVSTLERAEIPFEVHRTEGVGHGRTLATMLAERGVARILVVGGDGTFHEVANGVLPPYTSAEAAPALALLPQGTGNDFHKLLRARGTLKELPELLKRGVERHIDVGWVRWDGGEAHFVNLLGVGIDVAVLRRRGAFLRLPGILQYLAALATALRSFRAVPIRWEAEEEGGERVHEGRTLLTAVTVGPSVGGGFFLSPRAEPEDGFLDLFGAGDLGLLQVARYLPGILRGTLEENRHIVRSRLRRIRITPQAGGDLLSFELDGELMDVDSSFLEVEVRPTTLAVLDLPEEGR